VSREAIEAGADALFDALQSTAESPLGDGWRHAGAVGLLYQDMATGGCPFRDARIALQNANAIDRDGPRDLIRVRPQTAPPAPPAPPALPAPPASTTPMASPVTSTSTAAASSSAVRRECPLCLTEYDLDDVYAVVCGHVFCGTCAPTIQKRKSCIVCSKDVSLTVKLVF